MASFGHLRGYLIRLSPESLIQCRGSERSWKGCGIRLQATTMWPRNRDSFRLGIPLWISLKISLPYWAATVGTIGRERPTAIALCFLTAPKALPILRHVCSPAIRQKNVLGLGPRCNTRFVTLQNSHLNQSCCSLWES